MKYVLIVLKMLVLLGSAGADERDRYVVTFAPSDDGRVQVFSIPRAEAKNLPAWNPGIEEPPLSVGEAVNAARAWLKNLSDGSNELPLEDVHVARKRAIGKNSIGLNDIWFYHLLFSTALERRSDPVKMRYVVVLMDGRTLTGEIMTEEEFEGLLLRR